MPNVVVALVTKDARAPTVERHLQRWFDAGEPLHAPSLFLYEVMNAFVRLVVAGRLDQSDSEAAWARGLALPIQIHTIRHGAPIMDVALQLGRQSAYDAVYVFLAHEFGAELWTLDGPLARNAVGIGFPVQLMDQI